jgi:hypothetical protein
MPYTKENGMAPTAKTRCIPERPGDGAMVLPPRAVAHLRAAFTHMDVLIRAQRRDQGLELLACLLGHLRMVQAMLA